jgi:2-polyprenyl-3-methyl-5-hydroxy-6-metoxy-1,4-benzoquinol methylase
MPKIKCIICNIEDYKVIYKSNLDSQEPKEEKIKQFTYASETKKIGQIVKCKKCGLVYVNPQENNIEGLYEETEDKNYELSRETRKITFNRDIRDIEKIKRNGKILDIGCSTGIFLEVAKKRGWDVYGIELSKWAYKKARKVTPNIYNKTLDKCKFKDNFFDVITMWDLIEHLTNPDKEIKETNKILKKDGLLVITTPNINCFFSRITGRKWWNILRMHLFYFSPETITKLLQKNGFRIIKIESYSRTITLKYAIDWFKPYKKIYKILEIIKKSRLGDLKLKINTHDTMIVYAKKK